MKIRLHKNFGKQYKKLKTNEQKKLQERLAIFLDNPFSPLLNNHPLKGDYLNYRSINITGDLRAIYKICDENECLFVTIDSHSNLYF